MEDKLIDVNRVSFSYRIGSQSEVSALHNLDLTVRRGEYLAVVGQNGSGKSTLAKHLNGLLIPVSGEVRIDGLATGEKENIPAIRQKVGMVFQNPDNQLVSTLVEEDVAFGPENLGVPSAEIRARVDWALETLHMQGFRHESPDRLSQGQKQLVAIAGVLAMKPECIVLDEPTALLDPHSRLEVLRILKRLNRDEGITIILITHFMQEAIGFDRIVVMAEGEIKMDGPPREIFRQAEPVKKLGMDLPLPLQLALKLRAAGFAVPADILSAEELVESICRLR